MDLQNVVTADTSGSEWHHGGISAYPRK